MERLKWDLHPATIDFPGRVKVLSFFFGTFASLARYSSFGHVGVVVLLAVPPVLNFPFVTCIETMGYISDGYQHNV